MEFAARHRMRSDFYFEIEPQPALLQIGTIIDISSSSNVTRIGKPLSPSPLRHFISPMNCGLTVQPSSLIATGFFESFNVRYAASSNLLCTITKREASRVGYASNLQPSRGAADFTEHSPQEPARAALCIQQPTPYANNLIIIFLSIEMLVGSETWPRVSAGTDGAAIMKLWQSIERGGDYFPFLVV